MLSSAT
jgi:PiT family inorganic phosphate transporter